MRAEVQINVLSAALTTSPSDTIRRLIPQCYQREKRASGVLIRKMSRRGAKPRVSAYPDGPSGGGIAVIHHITLFSYSRLSSYISFPQFLDFFQYYQVHKEFTTQFNEVIIMKARKSTWSGGTSLSLRRAWIPQGTRPSPI